MPKSLSDGPIARIKTSARPVVGWSDDEAANHHIVSHINEATSADVGQNGTEHRVDIVNFNQSDAGSAVFSGNDGSVRTRIEGGDNGRLEIIVWLQSSRFNLRCWLSFQLSLVTTMPLASCSSKTGSSKAPSKPALPRAGPIARTTTCFGESPVMMKPPMRTFSRSKRPAESRCSAT
jgi:hypothetical protein